MTRRRRRDAASAVLAGGASAAAAEVESALTVGADPAAAAFFDCDNTMMAGASIYYFARGLSARKFITSRDLLSFGWQQVKYRVGGRENHAGMVDAREAALAFVVGWKVEDIIRYGEEIYDELMDGRIYSGSRALAQHHLEVGQRVWLITATPVELAEVVAHRLGFTGALGTVAESVNGIYTGRLVGEPLHGPAKAEAIKALAEQEGLDLSRCSAYSDSANDVPMLSLVGHPMAINADPDLRRYAKERGWPTRDFRTGRKAAKIGVPAAGGLGMLTGAVVAGIALRRRVAA